MRSIFSRAVLNLVVNALMDSFVFYRILNKDERFLYKISINPYSVRNILLKVDHPVIDHGGKFLYQLATLPLKVVANALHQIASLLVTISVWISNHAMWSRALVRPEYCLKVTLVRIAVGGVSPIHWANTPFLVLPPCIVFFSYWFSCLLNSKIYSALRISSSWGTATNG